MKSFKNYLKESEPLFSTDNPGGEWLKHEQERIKAKGKDKFGVPAFGSTTGYFSSPVKIPIEKLIKVRGRQNEQKNVRHDSLDWLKNTMKETGSLPKNENGKEQIPFVQVDHEGKPWVNEGNHRIMAAHALGWKHLPVNVTYHSGGEEVSGDWHPQNILSGHKTINN